MNVGVAPTDIFLPFNFADIFITLGVILLLFDNIFYKKNET